MKRTVSFIVLLAMLLLTGCANGVPATSDTASAGQAETQSPESSAAASTPVATAGTLKQLSLSTAAPLLPEDINYEDTSYALAAEKAGMFGMSITAKLLKKDQNLLFSPLSVYLALSCLSNAATGDAAAQMKKTLYPEGMDQDGFNKANAELLGFLLEDPPQPLDTATLVCTDDDLNLSRKFAQAALDYYRGETATVNFGAPGAKEAINQWADKKTRGLIPSVLSQDPPPATVCVLANSLYFSNRWKWEFDPKDTKEQEFKGSLKTAKAPFMLHEGKMHYYEDDAIQACRQEFMGSSAMTVILPKEGMKVEDIVRDFTSLEEKLGQMGEREGTLRLPRFTMDSDNDLKPVLRELGLSAMFDSTQNSFGGLLEEQSVPVYISDAFQKTRIEVDEKGTTAAAVTVAIAAGAAAPPPNPPPPFVMNVDHPYVFLLTQHARAGEALLFVGVVNNLK